GERRDRYRYRQEHVPRCWSGWQWRNCAAAEVVAGTGGSTVCQYAAVPCRHGGLRWRASPQSPAEGVWSRCAADAGQVRPSLLEGAEGDNMASRPPWVALRLHIEQRRASGRTKSKAAPWSEGPEGVSACRPTVK